MRSNLLFAPIAIFGKSESFCSGWGERPREPDLCNDLGFGALSIPMGRVLDAAVFRLRLAGTLAPPLRLLVFWESIVFRFCWCHPRF